MFFFNHRKEPSMNATVKKDLYAQVTDSIVAMMEEGMTRHIQWVRTGHGLPCNHQTGIPYQGVNVLLLWSEAMRQGYSTSRWLTFNQAAAMGGQVRKGEKSLQCVFFGSGA
jgi:antirestriction protein ArdC